MYDKNLLFILTILEAIEKIFIYSRDYDSADIFYEDDDQKSFNAVTALLIAIGEESKKIDSTIKERSISTNLKLISGMRDKISDNYRGIDPEIIWDVINNNLEILKEDLNKIFSLSKSKYRFDDILISFTIL